MSQPQNNLPFQLTSLVGRQREISEVGRLLADARLLTLTGPGGSGKTRLALAVASEVVEGYEDGVWLVELAPLSDPELVVQAVASVLRVSEQPGSPFMQTLAEALKDKKMLLVLDNCEHLIEACAELVGTLLSSCQNLKILATSREALGITGESSWPVPPLSLPDPRRLPAVDGLSSYEAARLFLERAVAVEPSFEITEQNALAVAQLCYRLEGIPLAIELAAARTKVLSVEQISGRLEESLRLLSGGGRTAMPRHRTLRATMDWSHGLLNRGERTLFRRLSVFAGGFTLEAAEGVCAGGSIGEVEVLDLLASLTDKSLVLFEERQDDGPRYRLLETVRQYALEQLEESGEAERVRERHARFFLELAEEAEPELRGHGQLEWLDRLETEHDNLRAATRFLLDTGATESAARMLWALWVFWRVRGHQGEGYRYAGEALEREDVLSTRARAQVLYARGIMSYMSYGLESMEHAERLLERSADLFRQVQDSSGLALALGGLALTTMAQGELGRASALLEEALQLHREMGNRWGVASVLSAKGLISLSRGEYEQAARYFEDGLEIIREVGDRFVSSITLHNLAWASRLQGDHVRALRLYTEEIGIAVELGDEAGVANCLEGMADLLSTEDQAERKARLYGASEAILETIGAPLYVQTHDRDMYKRTMEELHSRLGEEAFEAAWAEGREMPPERAVEYALEVPEPPEDLETPPEHPAGLSSREVEVLRLVARGMTNAQIAQELFLSPRTVNWHLGSVYRKLGFGSRAEATRFASEHGLLG